MEKEVVLITGASSGIGKATAEYLASKGYIVYGAARQPKETPKTFVLLAMDVRQEDSVRAGVAHILEKEGHIDILINNAGVGITGAIEETPIDALENAFQTNFFGAIRTIQAILPLFHPAVAGYFLE